MDTSTDKITRAKQKVEKMGIFFEKLGHTPMRGRVFAYLLLAEPPYKDFYDIQEFLAASKSSISNALNDLMKEGIVDYITFSGDRKRYFRVNPEGWLKTATERIKQASHITNLIQEVLDERKDSKHIHFNEGLEKMINFFSFFSTEIDSLMARWEAQQSGE